MLALILQFELISFIDFGILTRLLVDWSHRNVETYRGTPPPMLTPFKKKKLSLVSDYRMGNYTYIMVVSKSWEIAGTYSLDLAAFYPQ